MTSINTNVAAQTALRTLQQTNSQLDQTQSRISTGLKIGSAKDNAAYWSISTTMKSDNKSLATVKDALALGAGSVDVAYQGLNSSLDVLNEIKSKLTAASNPSADRAAIQAELTQLFDQLTAFADAASFGGENWLAGAAAAVTPAPDAPDAPADRTNDRLTAIETAINGVTPAAADADTPGSVAFSVTNAATLIDGDTLTLNVTVGSDSAQAVTINVAGLTDGNLDAAALRAALQAAIDGGTLEGVTVGGAGDNVELTGTTNNVGVTIAASAVIAAEPDVEVDPDAPAASTEKKIVTGFTRDGNAITLKSISIDTTDFNLATLTAGVGEIAISTATTAAEFQTYLGTVQTAINKVTSAAAELGAVSSRIELQQSFVSTLMDTIDKGISGLVDADMNEESTRLQALQVKQQLGVQALSIANQSAQNVLRLFQ